MIGRAYGKCHNTIRAVLLPPRLALTSAEREGISRGVAWTRIGNGTVKAFECVRKTWGELLSPARLIRWDEKARTHLPG